VCDLSQNGQSLAVRRKLRDQFTNPGTQWRWYAHNLLCESRQVLRRSRPKREHLPDLRALRPAGLNDLDRFTVWPGKGDSSSPDRRDIGFIVGLRMNTPHGHPQELA
jgi:hypothetical protein